MTAGLGSPRGSNMDAVVISIIRCTRCGVCYLYLSGLVLGMQNSLVERLEVVTQRDEVCVLLRQLNLWSDDLEAESSDALLVKQHAVVIIFPLWENLLELYMDAAGCSPLSIHQIPYFLYIRNLVYHLLTASQSVVTILCGLVDCLLARRYLQLWNSAV